jgi:hypothetical protein
MNFARFRQPAVSAVAVLLISGAGIAFAGNRAPAVSSPKAAPAAPAVAPAIVPAAAPTAAPTAAPVEPVVPDADTLQQGDQTTPDSPAAPATEKAGTEKAGTETTGAEEPGDASLPGGGHADNPSDPNADHQFDGVE